MNMGYVAINKYSLILPICAFFVLIIFTYNESSEKTLLIGILSAPDNFEFRESLRRSWLQDVGNNDAYYFLIGKQFCKVPIEDRIDVHSCTELPVFVPEDESKTNTLHSGTFTCYDSAVSIHLGYSFIVQYDIIIKRFGIISNFCEHTIKVNLIEAATGSKITSAVFFCGESLNSSTLWQNVENYRLPKGFEGRIIWESVTSSIVSIPRSNCGYNWHSAGNIFAYQMFWDLNGLPGQFLNKSLTPVTIAFEIPGINDLRKFKMEKSKRLETWGKKITAIKEKVHHESKEMGDILFLDVIDVYRSLPKKMLEFYKWADKNMKFSYLLKTDDDSYVNISAVKKSLLNFSQNNQDLSSQLWWWSVLREEWIVQWSGKWRETSYKSFTYPPFPCGAGYVLSWGITKILSSLADKLYTNFQGEDVSLGIWLSGIHPKNMLDETSCIWVCKKDIKAVNNCNYPELSPKEIVEIHYYRKDE